MRIAPRPMPAVRQPTFRETAVAKHAASPQLFATDSFAAKPTSTKDALKSAAKTALTGAAEQAFSAVLSKLVESLTAKLGQLIEQLVSKIGGKTPAQPQLPPGAPVEPSEPAAPAAPPSPAGGLLAPTPLAKEVPNQTGYVNTIKEPHIAPRSQFREVVNQAIDTVMAKGIGVDPQDRTRITDYDQYHSAVVSELRARGYNAAYDGEELAVGRKNDSFSEQFDISTSTGLVRRFYAAWLSPPVWA